MSDVREHTGIASVLATTTAIVDGDYRLKFSSESFRRAAVVILAGYWLALFVATHIPKIPKALQAPGSDKWQHAIAYAGLAFLLINYRSFGKPLTWKLTLGVAGVVIVFGAVDELTQIPVGRDAEFGDWLADCLGALVGIGLYAVLQSRIRRIL